MTADETTDSGLSTAAEHELRTLLHRAADGVAVSAAPHRAAGGAELQSRPAVRSSRRGRHGTRTIAAIAAAMALIVAGGAWVLVGPDGGDRVSTGPADANGFVSGPGDIWRLPIEPPGGMELTDAMTSIVGSSFQLAVDDPAAPTRWIAIIPAGMSFEAVADEPAVSGTLADGGTYAVYLPLAESITGATWAELTGPGTTGYLTIAALGVDDQTIIGLLTEFNGRVENLTDVEAMNSALRTITPPEGLVPAWNPDQVGFATDDPSPAATLALIYSSSDGGRQVALSITRTGTAAAVGALGTLVQLDPTQRSGDGPGRTVTRREDLGPGTIVVESYGETSLIVFSDDGVRITASEMAGSGSALGLVGLLEVVRRLRPTTEDEVRTQLDALGVEVTDMNDRSGDPVDSVSGSTVPPSTVLSEGPTTTMPG